MIPLLCVVLLPSTSRVFTCKDGSQSKTASEAQADAASPPGSIIAGVSQICPEDVALGISEGAGEAKEYLRSLKPGKNTCLANPQFGVCFPLASWDPVHLVPGGITSSGESMTCASMGITKPCDRLTIDPKYFRGHVCSSIFLLWEWRVLSFEFVHGAAISGMSLGLR